jgi:hypothetical protein
MPSLKRNVTIQTLALDLGLKASTNPVEAILGFCDRRVQKITEEFDQCSRPAELLDILAQKLKTTFEVIAVDSDLASIKQKYVAAGEKWFVRLEAELPENTYGVTVKRLARKPWDTEYVSIVDARGTKAYRANHTKWHELGHLLVLTDQARLSFQRTFCIQDLKDPEESLVDVIAGYFEYWPKFFAGKLQGRINFGKIEEIRQAVCPEASKYSSVLGMAKMWPTPCILIEARLGYKKQDRQQLNQKSFGFKDQPQKALRVTNVTINDPAKQHGIQFHPNWRVPKNSIISKVFNDGLGLETAQENLSWWETSTGQRLRPCSVEVHAKLNGTSVQALLVP